VNVRLTAPARRQADRLDRWWRANRPLAVDLFARELDGALRQIGEAPEIGPPYVERQGTVVRRVLLPRTKNHVYYEIDGDEGVVMILAVWGAPKKRGPKLTP
jgi:plasmid stabilization system protein ParE